MHSINNIELSSLEETRCQFNGGTGAIKLGIYVHQDFYVVVMQEDGGNPKPPQRFAKQAFLYWAAKLKQSGAEVHAVYEACGFGFTLQRQLAWRERKRDANWIIAQAKTICQDHQ